MPEYSSTTITPADAVQTPAMNGSISGNYTLSALRDFILASKGQANGLASLGADGKLTSTQLPDLADDVLVYDSYALLPNPGIAGKIYITADNNEMYRWDDALTTPDYVELSVDLSDYALVSEIQDGTIQAGVAVQAWQDILGNAIITTYETKAEANDLKNAITANSKRITNLEIKAGDEIPVTYPSATYGMDGVPASVAPYAKVRELILNSRVRNQMINTATYSPRGATTITVDSDGYFNLSVPNWTSGTCGITLGGSFDSTHFYLTFILCKTYNLTESPNWRLYDSGSSYLADGDWRHNNGFAVSVLSPNANSSYSGLYFTPSSNAETVSLKFQSKDLTKYFGTSDLSFLGATNADKLATIQRDYPELLIPSDYDTGTRVDTTYSAVKSVGVNICEEGTGNIYNGGNLIPVFAGQQMFVYAEYTYTDSKYLICNVWGTNTTSKSDQTLQSVEYIQSGTVYTINITANGYFGLAYNAQPNTYTITKAMISRTTFTASDYVPFSRNTLTLPSPVTGKSAGSVHQIYYPETGEMTEPLGSVDLGTLNWNHPSANRATTTDLGSVIKPPINTTSLGNYLSANPYTQRTASSTLSNEGDYAVTDSGGLVFYYNGTDPSGMFYYELATPNPNSQATVPVLDLFIKVEGGGTIRPIQTQTTQIDSSMSADYLGV